jgi:hypothetical protein
VSTGQQEEAVSKGKDYAEEEQFSAKHIVRLKCGGNLLRRKGMSGKIRGKQSRKMTSGWISKWIVNQMDVANDVVQGREGRYGSEGDYQSH